MRAQLAVIEAIVASSIGALLFSSVTYISYSYSSGGMQGVVLHEAVFDIVGIAYRNSTFRACLAVWDEACIGSYLSSFRSIYSLQYISVQNGAASIVSGSSAACLGSVEYCVPMHQNITYTEYCFRLCGG